MAIHQRIIQSIAFSHLWRPTPSKWSILSLFLFFDFLLFLFDKNRRFLPSGIKAFVLGLSSNHGDPSRSFVRTVSGQLRVLITFVVLQHCSSGCWWRVEQFFLLVALFRWWVEQCILSSSSEGRCGSEWSWEAAAWCCNKVAWAVRLG